MLDGAKKSHPQTDEESDSGKRKNLRLSFNMGEKCTKVKQSPHKSPNLSFQLRQEKFRLVELLLYFQKVTT